MAKGKTHKKKKMEINIRTVTTWTSIAAFGLMAVIIGLTGWFVWDSLRRVGQPPDLTAIDATERIDTINTRLLGEVETALEKKTGTTITPSDSLPNPFKTKPEPTPAPVPEPAEPPTEPTQPEPESEATGQETGGQAAAGADDQETVPDTEAE